MVNVTHNVGACASARSGWSCVDRSDAVIWWVAFKGVSQVELKGGRAFVAVCASGPKSESEAAGRDPALGGETRDARGT